MLLKRILLGSLASTIGTAALAIDTNHTDIQVLKAWHNRTEVQLATTHGCAGGPNNHFRLYSDAPNYNVMASILVTAYATRARVNISYECGNDARINGIRAFVN